MTFEKDELAFVHPSEFHAQFADRMASDKCYRHNEDPAISFCYTKMLLDFTEADRIPSLVGLIEHESAEAGTTWADDNKYQFQYSMYCRHFMKDMKDLSGE